MKGLLRAKPGAIFALTFVPGFVLGIIYNYTDIEMEFFGEHTSGIVQVITMLPLYLWFIAIASGLKDELPNSIKAFYKPGGFIFGILLHMAVMFWMGGIMDELMELVQKLERRSYISNSLMGDLLAVYGKLLLAVVAMIVALLPLAGHLCKIIKSGQTGKKETYATAKLEFWMLIINVVGVWIVQPRINKIMAGEYKKNWETEPKELSDSDEILD